MFVFYIGYWFFLGFLLYTLNKVLAEHANDYFWFKTIESYALWQTIINMIYVILSLMLFFAIRRTNV
jgi:hypothetical protein